MHRNIGPYTYHVNSFFNEKGPIKILAILENCEIHKNSIKICILYNNIMSVILSSSMPQYMIFCGAACSLHKKRYLEVHSEPSQTSEMEILQIYFMFFNLQLFS